MSEKRPVPPVEASVVIPTHDRARTLQRVLESFALQRTLEESFEVIVVDDGSEDETRTLFDRLPALNPRKLGPDLERYRERIKWIAKGEYAPDGPKALFHEGRALRLAYVQILKSGRSIARNIGVLLSRSPIVIFSDDDIFVEAEYVKKHVAVHTFNDRCVVMGRVIHTESLDNPMKARWKLKDINTAFLATGNASVKRKHLLEAGLFDEGYTAYGWEDFDLGIHLEELGLKSLKRAVYGYHYEPRERALVPEVIYRKERERGFSAVYFYKKHPLAWVRRFTLIDNRFLRGFFMLMGRNNWFLKKQRVSLFKGLMRLVIRYKGYFDGIEKGKKELGLISPE